MPARATSRPAREQPRTLRPSGRLAIALLALAALHRPAYGAAPAAAEPPAAAFGETVEVNVVSVDVFVTDRAGQAVGGLKKGDFQLYEDGKPVDIANFAELARAAERAPDAALPPAAQKGAPPFSSSAAPGQSYIAVYVDNANLRPGNRQRVLQQLRRFLAQNVVPGTQVMIASDDLSLHVETPFTSDPVALARAIDGAEARQARGGEADRTRATALNTMLELQKSETLAGDPCSHLVKSPVEAFAATTRQEAMRTVGNLNLLVSSLSGVPGRKTLLYVTDGLPLTPAEELSEAFNQICSGGAAHSGVDLGDVPVFDMSGSVEQVFLAPISPLDAEKNSIAKSLDQLTARANANRVSFYTVQATGAAALAASSAGSGPEEAVMRLPGVATAMIQNYQNSLSLLAANTGGKAILNANQIGDDLGKMWGDLTRYYSLGFAPAHKADGRDHRIEVRVKRADLRVRHLQSYRDKPLLERTIDRTLAALLYGVEDNPLEVQLEAQEPVAGDKGLYTVPLRLRIPLFKLGILNQEATFTGSLRLFVATRASGGAISPVRQVAVPIRIPRGEVLRAMGQFFLYNLTLQLAPGEQRVAVAVRDELAAATSYLARPVSVPGAPPGAGVVPAAEH